MYTYKASTISVTFHSITFTTTFTSHPLIIFTAWCLFYSLSCITRSVWWFYCSLLWYTCVAGNKFHFVTTKLYIAQKKLLLYSVQHFVRFNQPITEVKHLWAWLAFEWRPLLQEYQWLQKCRASICLSSEIINTILVFIIVKF